MKHLGADHSPSRVRARARQGRRWEWALSLSLALLVAACVTDHHQLAEQPPGSAGTTGLGGAPSEVRPSDGSLGGAPALQEAGSGARDAAAGADASLPSGPVAFTWLNGVIDAPWIGLCFAPVHGGQPGSVSGDLAPPGGIPYGHTATLTSVSGAELGTDDVLPYVIAAKGPDAVSGLDCARIIAAAGAPFAVDSGVSNDASAAERDASLEPPDATIPLDGSSPVEGGAPPSPPIAVVRVSELPIVPSAAFLEVRRFLIALGGCVGGPGVTDPSEKSVCGERYSPTTPTLSAVVLKFPAAPAQDRVGLSFLSGTPAVRSVSLVELRPASDQPPFSFAKNIPTGGVRPPAPDDTHTVAGLGADGTAGSILVFADSNPSPIYDEPWQTTFAASGVPSLSNGHVYTLALIGPYPGFAKNAWWNAPVVTLVDDALFNATQK